LPDHLVAAEGLERSLGFVDNATTISSRAVSTFADEGIAVKDALLRPPRPTL
jgi:hypothetical protein